MDWKNRTVFLPIFYLRQRKDNFGEIGYTKSIMNEILNIGEESVASILQQWPQTNRVFLNQKTACVGCYLSRFCTLAEVATSYELPLDVLLEKLRVSIQIPNEE